MAIAHLYHVAIKTNDLALTVRFYTDVLGLVRVPRPPFKHNGAWLAVSGEDPLIHIYEAGPYVADGGPAPSGTAAIDHVSILATGFDEYVERFRSYGLEWREFDVPGTDLWQLFVHDPSGVMLELTFMSSQETGQGPDMSEGRSWRADENFFKPYASLPELRPA